MINKGLVRFLEANFIFTNIQCGFRKKKQRSTIDQFVRFKTFIRDVFVNNEHEVSVFFDLETAYDTT